MFLKKKKKSKPKPRYRRKKNSGNLGMEFGENKYNYSDVSWPVRQFHRYSQIIYHNRSQVMLNDVGWMTVWTIWKVHRSCDTLRWQSRSCFDDRRQTTTLTTSEVDQNALATTEVKTCWLTSGDPLNNFDVRQKRSHVNLRPISIGQRQKRADLYTP